MRFRRCDVVTLAAAAAIVLNAGAVHAAQRITEYPLPLPNSYPYYIASGPDGALWFTEYYPNKIGRITTGGAVTEYPVPTYNSLPSGIAAGPDGNLWFTEQHYELGKIGKITTEGSITE